MNLGVLMERVMIDPLGLIDLVIQPALDQLACEGGVAGHGDSPPEELIATALGNRLARMIADEGFSTGVDWSADGRRNEEVALPELVDRNRALAAAVGACDCWGHCIDCPFCKGAGAPGWGLPDRRLFASYVYPAVKAVSRCGVSQSGIRRRTENHRRENQHV